MNTTGWAVVIIALIIVLGGGWWLASSQPPAPAGSVNVNAGANAAGTIPEGSETPSNDMVGGDADASGATTGITVRYDASGFAPKSVTISAGQKVTFVNDGAGPMWVASAEHPTHAVYDGSDRVAHCSGSYTGATPFDQCQNGPTYTFVFNKAGTYQYHNHSAAQFGGTVVVR